LTALETGFTLLYIQSCECDRHRHLWQNRAIRYWWSYIPV